MAENVFNLKSLDDLSGGDESFTASMVEVFLEHTPGQLEDLKSAQAKGDMATVGSLAHKIKPNIDLFGIESIREDIRTLESLGKAGENNAEMQRALAEVDRVLQIAFEQLKNL